MFILIMIMKNNFLKKYTTEIDLFIKSSLKEDIGKGDISSLSCLNNDIMSTVELISNESCIIAGIELTKRIIKKKNTSIILKSYVKDGDYVIPNEKIFLLNGPQLDILSIERLILNCIQRMSGVATLTNKLSNKISHTACKLLDTRKTTPNFRYPEKWAVIIGGGLNNRMGLFDAIMIKDNHVDFCKSITSTLKKTEKFLIKNQNDIPVIVETRNLNEIKECFAFPWIKRILLDNMNLNQLKKAVKLINKEFEIEASGNIDEKNIVKIAETGVDFVSLGALTHSYKNIDLTIRVI